MEKLAETDSRDLVEKAIRAWLDTLSGDTMQRIEFMGYIIEEAASEITRLTYDLRYPNVGPKEAAEHGDYHLHENKE